MRPMTPADFEARYRADGDPWDYRDSAYERDKYAATLDACGDGPFASALELGASIGVFTALLAPRCAALATIDLAPTAVAAARRRLTADEHVRVVLGTLPDDLPVGEYDLVVASEILYYLAPDALRETLRRLRSVMLEGARLVAVHWRPTGPDRRLDATAVHAALRAQPWLEPVHCGGSDEYRLDVLRRR